MFLLLLVTFYQCEKDEQVSKFPQNTEVGANTFCFRVNGGEIINSEVGYIPSNPRIHIFYNHNDPYFNGKHRFELMGGKNIFEINKYVTFFVTDMPSKGEYQLTEFDNEASYENVNPNELYYKTDTNNNGVLNITKLDTTSHIISGKFKFKAKRWCLSGNCNEVINIEGQFDIEYIPNRGINYY